MYKQVLLSLFIVLLVGVVAAQETMTVEMDVFVLDGFISIEVPDYIYVGNLSWPGEKETDRVKVQINNTGIVDVSISAELVDPQEEIFSYLYFFNRTYNDPVPIGTNWSISIDESDDDYFYMKLDLTDYDEDFDEDFNHRADINFIAVER